MKKTIAILLLTAIANLVHAQSNIYEVNGNVGIGVGNPSERLELSGNVYCNGEYTGFLIDEGLNRRVGLIKYPGREGGIWRTIGQDFEMGRVDVPSLPGIPQSYVVDMRIDGNGNIGIGTSSPAEKLSVNGKIRAHELKVESNPNTWPDYVFKPSYKLMPLHKVEAFIKTNGHLPEVPSAKEVESKGIEVGANQALLLKKIEELTLYMIELKKENEGLKREMADFRKAVQKK